LKIFVDGSATFPNPNQAYSFTSAKVGKEEGQIFQTTIQYDAANCCIYGYLRVFTGIYALDFVFRTESDNFDPNFNFNCP
jgi:hypothetical protein